MDMRGGSRDGAVNRTLEGSERDNIVIESADVVSPTLPGSHSHSRGLSESQNLLPNSPKNLFEYSSTTRYIFDPPENTKYDPRSAPKINGRETPTWSGVPQSLRRTTRRRWQDAAIDVLAILASMPFFALASALIWVDGEEVGKGKDNSLEQLIKGAATLFPLVFSVVVGRTMIKIASWKAGRGTSIGFLERLLGSRTVGGTIITAIGLRSFTIGSLILILLWLLSPLGSQSVLRILSTTDRSTNSTTNITYINSRQQSYAGQVEMNNWSNGLASVVSASLLAPEEVKSSSMDTWGNVKIPLFSSLSNISEDDNGWRQIPQSDFSLVHSSLLGIPVSDVGNGNSTFNLESTYTELTCSNRTSTVTRGTGFFINPGLISTTGPFIAAQNITSTTAWAIGYLGDDVTSLLPNTSIQALDTLPINDTTMNNVLPGLLLYQDFTGTSNVTSIYCIPSQTYVESTITCASAPNTSPSCTVTAQRLSLLANKSSAITPLSISNLFRGLSSYLPAATPQLNHVDIMQNYIYSPLDNPFIQSAQYPLYTSPSGQESRFLNLSFTDFSIRLSQVLNAVLQGSTMNYTTYLTSSSSFSSSTSTISSTPSDLDTQIQLLAPTLSVPSTTTHQINTYKISPTYLTLFLLSTTFLLLTALLSLLLTQITLSPSSYINHLTSLLRDSPHLPLPAGGVSISGFRRAREVGGMRVRLGDVGNVDGGYEIGVGAAVVVGRVGLGLLGEKDGRGGVRGLDRRKLYL
ncbi:uncharacterized protein LY89DRAFT_778016 [Mollisia scopiformis]|uniref:Uncharacterized protein n=1 Tax=Mollisia scopiformis TaxID=149040 RepID=A0A194XN83_MOLSC|nr:uncharacterized protein LY89DRAFT_778016 [Mollisia scopiformis]KUJ21601.1 hypothetical protein LY89DRAFT_778016 [Mollisia scopiformis]